MSLAEIMKDTFDIVERADNFRRESKSKIIMRLIQQTTECAWFIRDYMKIEEFCKWHEIIIHSVYSFLRRETTGEEHSI